MAAKKSETATQVPERPMAAISAPTARRARMQKLGTYILQGPSTDPGRIQNVAEISQRAYKIMEAERKGPEVNAPAPAKPIVKEAESPRVGVNPKPPKSDSAKKREAAQKAATPKKTAQPKAKPDKKSTKKVDQKPATPVETVPAQPEGEILPEAAADTDDEK